MILPEASPSLVIFSHFFHLYQSKKMWIGPSAGLDPLSAADSDGQQHRCLREVYAFALQAFLSAKRFHEEMESDRKLENRGSGGSSPSDGDKVSIFSVPVEAAKHPLVALVLYRRLSSSERKEYALRVIEAKFRDESFLAASTKASAGKSDYSKSFSGSAADTKVEYRIVD